MPMPRLCLWKFQSFIYVGKRVQEQGPSPSQDFNEQEFTQYLKNSCNPKTIKERLIYAKKFAYVLDPANGSDILSLKPDDRNR